MGRRQRAVKSIPGASSPILRTRSQPLERPAGLRADFLSDLVEARDQGDKLNDEELFGMLFGLFGALAATSRSAGGALYTLYTHTAGRVD